MALLLSAPANTAAINYLIVTATVSASTAPSTSVSMTASISNICPVGASAIYYGIGSGQIVVGGSATSVPPTTGVLCVVGVPNAVTLTPVVGSSFSPISLTLGGVAQAMNNGNTTTAIYLGTMYQSYTGILLPDTRSVVATATAAINNSSSANVSFSVYFPGIFGIGAGNGYGSIDYPLGVNGQIGTNLYVLGY